MAPVCDTPGPGLGLISLDISVTKNGRVVEFSYIGKKAYSEQS